MKMPDRIVRLLLLTIALVAGIPLTVADFDGWYGLLIGSMGTACLVGFVLGLDRLIRLRIADTIDLYVQARGGDFE